MPWWWSVPAGHATAALTGLMVLSAMAPLPCRADQRVPLQCQWLSQPWRSCTLVIEEAGTHWWLQLGDQRLDFRSDGRGGVHLRQNNGEGRVVASEWRSLDGPEPELCWDGLCTRGGLPLD